MVLDTKELKEKERVEGQLVEQLTEDLFKSINSLDERINAKFEKLKIIIIDYLTLGSDFAKGSLITALKQV